MVLERLSWPSPPWRGRLLSLCVGKSRGSKVSCPKGWRGPVTTMASCCVTAPPPDGKPVSGPPFCRPVLQASIPPWAAACRAPPWSRFMAGRPATPARWRGLPFVLPVCCAGPDQWSGITLCAGSARRRFSARPGFPTRPACAGFAGCRPAISSCARRTRPGTRCGSPSRPPASGLSPRSCWNCAAIRPASI